MRYLHNTLFPCNVDTSPQEMDIFKLDFKERIEAVKFSEGWGIFNNGKKYWVTEKDKRRIKELAANYVEYNPGKKAGETWHCLGALELEVELSRKCNQECVHCWNESTFVNEKLDTEVLKNTLATFRRYGGQRVLFTGGEPLQYRGLEDILAFGKQQGISDFGIISNGTLISKSSAKKLSQYLDTVNISVHGDSPQIHDSITTINGSYKRMRRGIENLRERGIKVLLYFSVMESNFESIPGMFDLVREWDCEGIRFKPLNWHGRGRNLTPMTAQGKRLLRNYIEQKSEEEGVRVITSELYQKEYRQDSGAFRFVGCNALRTIIYIQSNGNLLSCNLVPEVFGNIYQDNLYDVWTSQQAREFRDKRECTPKLKNCKSCGGGCKSIIK